MQNIVNEIEIVVRGASGEMNLDAIWKAAVMCIIIIGAGFVCNLISSLLIPALSQRTAEHMLCAISLVLIKRTSFASQKAFLIYYVTQNQNSQKTIL